MSVARRHQRNDSCDESTPLTINPVGFQKTTDPRCYSSSVVSSECIQPHQDEEIVPARNEQFSKSVDSLEVYGHRKDDQTMEARNIIDSALRVFPTALGLLVCISCNTAKVPGQNSKAQPHLGPEAMEQAFKFLGYAICKFHNPSSELFADICIMLANDTKFPPSYKRLFLYICAHGSDDQFHTTNGAVEVSDVIKKFMSVCSDLNIPRILIGDTCRGDIPGNVDPHYVLPIPVFYRQNPDEIFGDTLTFFSTSKHFKAYTFPEGAPVIAEILRDLLLMRDVDRNLLSILTIDVKVCLEEKAKKYPELTHVYPDCYTHLKEEIFLYKERLVPMTPTEVTVTKGCRRSEISWRIPLHAKHQKLENNIVIIRPSNGNEDEDQKYEVNKDETTIKIPTHRLQDTSVIIQANYEDGTKVATRPMPTNINRRGTWNRVFTYVTLAVCSFFLAALIIDVALVASTEEKPNMLLGISTDVIECAQPNWHRRLSDIMITVDDANGLQIHVFGVSNGDIEANLRSHIDRNLNLEQTLIGDDKPQNFTIPYTLYMTPWYLWSGSSIFISYHYSHKPSVGFLYLIKGENNHDNFNNDKPFHHERKFDLLQYDSGMIHWNINDNSNGYYFLAVSMNVKNGSVTDFKYNVTYTIRYIDPNTFSSLIVSGQKIHGKQKNVTLRHSLKSPNTNHTLCYLQDSNLAESFEDSGVQFNSRLNLAKSSKDSGVQFNRRVDLTVLFKTKLITWILPISILVVILVSYFSFLFLFFCVCRRYCTLWYYQ